jgi:SPP1 family predicted phage head-tail adaptor
MRAGRLNRLIQIETKTTVLDPEGSFTETWRLWKKVWAEVSQIKGEEQFAAGGVRFAIAYRLTFRWIASGRINVGTNRVNLEGRILDIEAVEDMNMPRKQISLVCTEGMTDG